MDILGHIPHNRKRAAAAHTVFQRRIRRHPEILRLVNDHMACLPDFLRLLHPLVQIGERRQVIDVKPVFFVRNRFALPLVLRQKLLIDFKNRFFPALRPEMKAELPAQLLFFLGRIADLLSRNLIVDFCGNALV